MCFQKISEFLTLKKFCGIVPLKEGIYISGFFLLIYCLYAEIQVILAMVWFVQNLDDTYQSTDPLLALGAGLTVLDFGVRATTNDTLSSNYLIGMMIGWAVMNTILIISTSLMIFAAIKGKAIYLIQFMVISLTILIGNIADIILSIITFTMKSTNWPNQMHKHLILELLNVAVLSVMLAYAFLVARSYYCIVSMPSVPVRFRTLERQENASESGESSKT